MLPSSFGGLVQPHYQIWIQSRDKLVFVLVIESKLESGFLDDSAEIMWILQNKEQKCHMDLF